MKTNVLLLTFALVFAGANGGFAATGSDQAAPNPATGNADQFFGPTNLYTFHLTIALDQWATMEELDEFKDNARPFPGGNDRRGGFRPGAPPGGPGFGPGGNPPTMGIDFKEGTARLEFEGQPFGRIRVRFKGNSSFNFARNSLKRSLKLDFNDLDEDQTFFGLTKLNLNNNAMDPSQMREALAYDVFRNGGVPAGRTAFAKVYITVPGRHDKAYAGLYTVVEQVDNPFLKARFGTKAGLLLKPERLPGLPYLGDNWSAYTNLVQPKSDVKAADARRFIEFVKFLNQSSDASFRAGIDEFVDVDEFLRFVALQALLPNLDSPLMTGHNYYLYLNPRVRKFIWIPWDLNEAFGGFFRAGTASEQANLSLDEPYTRVNRLAERLLTDPGTKKRYREIVGGLLATNFNSARLFPLVNAMAETIRPALANDRMVSISEFEAALSETSLLETRSGNSGQGFDFRGGGPGGLRRSKPPIKAFINQRVESARLQLAGKADGYVPRDIRPGPMGGPQPGGPPPRPPR